MNTNLIIVCAGLACAVAIYFAIRVYRDSCEFKKKAEEDEENFNP